MQSRGATQRHRSIAAASPLDLASAELTMREAVMTRNGRCWGRNVDDMKASLLDLAGAELQATHDPTHDPSLQFRL